MKILALAATNHQDSINQKLVEYTLTQFDNNPEIHFIDLNDYNLPIFSPEYESNNPFPEEARDFAQNIDWADLVIISFAEYNGSYTPVFKNLLDWASRVRQNLWNGTDLFFLATSPGARGAQTVLGEAASYAPYMGGNMVGTFSLPSFEENFANEKIINPSLDKLLHQKIKNILPSQDNPEMADFAKIISEAFVWLGYGLFALIVITGFLGSSLLYSDWVDPLWKLTLYAAMFTLIIRPIHDFIPQSKLIESMLQWRKGIGLISSGIVVGFWINRYIDLSDLSVFFSYFSAEKWDLNSLNILSRISEITGLILFLISSKWLAKNFNKLWRNLQKLAYVYFLSGATFVYLAYDQIYPLVCLILFFVIYQAWIYLKLAEGPQKRLASRSSQAS